MTNPGDFREAILALTVLGGGAFAVEQYIRQRVWPRPPSEGTEGGDRASPARAVKPQASHA